jgi:hypothetical protein
VASIYIYIYIYIYDVYISAGKLERRRTLGRPSCKFVGNIKMEPKIGCEDVDWTDCFRTVSRDHGERIFGLQTLY